MTTKRDAIIDSACHLIEVQGYHATGINQILEESGAPKGSLYYYFPEGKEGLASEAIERSSRLIESRIREVIAHGVDPAEGIRSFFVLLSERIEASDFRHGGPLTSVAVEAASTNERLRSACRNAYARWQEAFADRLREQYDDERAASLAALIVSALEGAIILSRSERNVAPLLAAGRELERLIRSG
jgi:TetR/AcrR family transcriptional repressor of lmrAB and yxaGH operons